MTGWARFIGWPAAVLGMAYFTAVSWVPKDKPDGMHWVAFGKLPVMHDGRVKPLDTVARLSLQIISGKQDVIDEKGQQQATAIQWLAELMAEVDYHQSAAAKRKIFRVASDQLLKFFDLKPRPGFYRYSYEELAPKLNAFKGEFRRVDAARENKVVLDSDDERIAELGDHLLVFQAVQEARKPMVLPPQSDDGAWRSLYEVAEAESHALLAFEEQQLRERGQSLANLKPQEFLEKQNKAVRFVFSRLGQSEGPAGAFMRVLERARAKDVAGFNEAVANYRTTYYPELTDDADRLVRFEAIYNHAQPFYHCAALYGVVLVLAAVSWLGAGEWLRRPAIGLATSVFIVHTAALIARMVIQGRPPVTNLYSSAIFIGWGCVGLLLLLERWYGNGIATFLAGCTGLSTLIVAHYLSLSGDTLEMMRAVLNTNFWLATHVTTVTLGYTATFVAGFIGVVYIIRGVCTPTLTPQASRSMADMIYGVVCFAMLLSFVGTVLGGIWGDQSWGRFWGWDTKENGAVLIVIWNALILHARWAGIVKHRGTAMLAVCGNIVTVWSWFGTNQLGVGLHNYGFNKQVKDWVVIVDAAMLAVIGLGAIPLSKWWSTTANAAAAKAVPPRHGRPVASR